jgi:hypothetical protein
VINRGLRVSHKSAIESAPWGCLSKLVAFFTASFSSVLPGDQVTVLSRMALSKKLSSTNWMFFRGVYNRLLTSYINSLEHDERLYFARFKDCFSHYCRIHFHHQIVFEIPHLHINCTTHRKLAENEFLFLEYIQNPHYIKLTATCLWTLQLEAEEGKTTSVIIRI